MEKTAKRTAKKQLTRAQIKQAYMEQVLTEEKEPRSVFAFAKKAKFSEEDFYKHFNSLSSLERALWADWMVEVLDLLDKDQTYAGYSMREKLLAFYFSWFEKMKAHRSFVLFRFAKAKREPDPMFLRSLKERFRTYADGLIAEGKQSGEVTERPFADQYARAFWVQFLFLFRFWLHDESEGFASTDAAIEKSVHLGFDLIGTGPIDRLVDFAKFLIQNQKTF